jgi:hypothetical protein
MGSFYEAAALTPEGICIEQSWYCQSAEHQQLYNSDDDIIEYDNSSVNMRI